LRKIDVFPSIKLHFIEIYCLFDERKIYFFGWMKKSVNVLAETKELFLNGCGISLKILTLFLVIINAP